MDLMNSLLLTGHNEWEYQIAVMPPPMDPDWHESHLLIQVMDLGPIPRTELFRHIRQEQSKKKVLGEEGFTHSKSAYIYWLKRLIAYRIAVERQGRPELTDLGKWIANSQTGTLEDRLSFISGLTCPDCRRKHGFVAVLRLEKGTAIIDSKGRICMDTECSRCGQSHRRMSVCRGFSPDQFIRFYNQAVSELRKAAAIMPNVILPVLP